MWRLWDYLDKDTRLELAIWARLRCFWAKDGELELEGPIEIEEDKVALEKIMRQPPQSAKAGHG